MQYCFKYLGYFWASASAINELNSNNRDDPYQLQSHPKFRKEY